MKTWVFNLNIKCYLKNYIRIDGLIVQKEVWEGEESAASECTTVYRVLRAIMESRPFYVIIKNTQQLFSEHQCISLTEKASLEKILLVLSTSAKRHMYLMFTLKNFPKSTGVLLRVPLVHNIERAQEANYSCIIIVINHDGISYAERNNWL